MALYRTGINEIASDRNFIEIWDLRDEETGLTTNKVHVADVFVGDYDAVEMADLFVTAPDLLDAAKKAKEILAGTGTDTGTTIGPGDVCIYFPDEEVGRAYSLLADAIRKAEGS